MFRHHVRFPFLLQLLASHPSLSSLTTPLHFTREYATGGELIEYIAARDHLTEKEARRFFRQIISAMDHCHMANVVHRDLKLENLLLNQERNILISDFGLGRTFQSDSEELMKVCLCFFSPIVRWNALSSFVLFCLGFLAERCF